VHDRHQAWLEEGSEAAAGISDKAADVSAADKVAVSKKIDA
jgi:hypothetical protein